MELRSESVKLRFDKIPKTRLRSWFIRVCSSIVVWTCLVQLVAVGELWHPHILSRFTSRLAQTQLRVETVIVPLPPARNYTSNGFLKVSCNGGLNQMRAAICDMVVVARLLNLTLVVPELDKTSFWADPSDFEDIFYVKHFVNTLRDEIRIIKRLPKKFSRKYGYQPLEMPPVSWSNEKYYLQQILPLFSKHKVIHFNKTDARLANNGLDINLQKLRCRVNFKALKFTPQIEALGSKLVQILQGKGPFVALHLRYEMDMLAFSGCTHGCNTNEAEELKQLRYAFPWWREKEIVSEERRSQGLCPLMPEEATLVLQALDFSKDTQIYIASGDIYGRERRLAVLRSAFPRIVKKEMLLNPEELHQFQNHTSQMAALDFMVSTASNIFIPTYDGNMARLVEGHRRYQHPTYRSLTQFVTDDGAKEAEQDAGIKHTFGTTLPAAEANHTTQGIGRAQTGATGDKRHSTRTARMSGHYSTSTYVTVKTCVRELATALAAEEAEKVNLAEQDESVSLMESPESDFAIEENTLEAPPALDLSSPFEPMRQSSPPLLLTTSTESAKGISIELRWKHQPILRLSKVTFGQMRDDTRSEIILCDLNFLEHSSPLAVCENDSVTEFPIFVAILVFVGSLCYFQPFVAATLSPEPPEKPPDKSINTLPLLDSHIISKLLGISHMYVILHGLGGVLAVERSDFDLLSLVRSQHIDAWISHLRTEVPSIEFSSLFPSLKPEVVERTIELEFWAPFSIFPTHLHLCISYVCANALKTIFMSSDMRWTFTTSHNNLCHWNTVQLIWSWFGKSFWLPTDDIGYLVLWHGLLTKVGNFGLVHWDMADFAFVLKNEELILCGFAQKV